MRWYKRKNVSLSSDVRCWQMKKILYQIIKFGGVGALCFVGDFSCLYLLTDCAGIPVLISSALAFIVSVLLNYYLSVKFVFCVDKNKSKVRNLVLFILFSIIGLGLTELIMALGVSVLCWNYLLVKILATGIVMVFNFITRKRFLE